MSGQIRSPNESVTWVSCSTCFMWYLGVTIQWWHAFLDLTKKRSRSGQFRSNFKISNFLTKNMLVWPVLSQDSKNIIYRHARQLEMLKVAFSEVTSSPLFGYWPLHSHTRKHCFGILRVACVLAYVSLQHAFHFLIYSKNCFYWH